MNDHTEDDDKKDAVLDEFAALMRRVEEQKEAAQVGLDEALVKITEGLTEHWTTGSGRRLRQIVWSIYNGSTLLALGDVLTNFDSEFGEAVAVLIRAKLAGVDDLDDRLRCVLKESGEMARYHKAADETPEDEVVLCPPIQVSASRLRELAESATKLERRIEAERRTEMARFAEEEARSV